MTRQTDPPEIKAQENERNAASMATRCTDPSYRMQENEKNAQSMATTRHTDPSYRMQGNERNVQAMATCPKLFTGIEEHYLEKSTRVGADYQYATKTNYGFNLV